MIKSYRATIGEKEYSVEIDVARSLVTIDGSTYPFRYEQRSAVSAHLVIDGRSLPILLDDRRPTVDIVARGTQVTVALKDEHDLLVERYGMQAGDAESDRKIKAPMPGLVLKVEVAVGDRVEKGDGIVILEAMKMENELTAPVPGVVQAVFVAEGDAVSKDAVLVALHPEP